MMLHTITLHSLQTGTKGPFNLSSCVGLPFTDSASEGTIVLDRCNGGFFLVEDVDTVGVLLFLFAITYTDSECRKLRRLLACPFSTVVFCLDNLGVLGASVLSVVVELLRIEKKHINYTE